MNHWAAPPPPSLTDLCAPDVQCGKEKVRWWVGLTHRAEPLWDYLPLCRWCQACISLIDVCFRCLLIMDKPLKVPCMVLSIYTVVARRMRSCHQHSGSRILPAVHACSWAMLAGSYEFSWQGISAGFRPTQDTSYSWRLQWLEVFTFTRAHQFNQVHGPSVITNQPSRTTLEEVLYSGQWQARTQSYFGVVSEHWTLHTPHAQWASSRGIN